MLGQCAGETMRLAVDRAGQRAEVVVACGGFYRGPAPRLSPVAEVTPGVWYVDLARLEPDLLTTSLPTLAAAHGVVVDMRGYPAGDAAAMLLTHVVTKPDVPWMHTPHWLRPNQEGPVSWAHDSWDLAPAAPHLGHVVFMTGPRAISFAESVLGYAQAEGLPIVGATSAGTNGDVREWTVPSGLTLRFTALRVTRHDGAPHHLRGIAPTIPVEPTLAGVRAGRDEVLERAIVEAGR